jgi:hypothetical protein
VDVVGPDSPVLNINLTQADLYYPAGPPYLATAKVRSSPPNQTTMEIVAVVCFCDGVCLPMDFTPSSLLSSLTLF